MSYASLFDRRKGMSPLLPVLLFFAFMLFDFARRAQVAPSLGFILDWRYLLGSVLDQAVTALALVFFSYHVRHGAALALAFGAGCVYASAFGGLVQAMGYGFFGMFIRPESALASLLWGVAVLGPVVLAMRVAGLRAVAVIPAPAVGLALLEPLVWLMFGRPETLTAALSAVCIRFGTGLILGTAFFLGLRALPQRQAGQATETPPPFPGSRPFPKDVFLTLFGLGAGVGGPLLLSAVRSPSALGALAGGVLMLVFAVSLAVMIYRMWSAIQDGSTRVSPGKALGFLFIPFFNLYWIFRVLPGFATEYNGYVGRRNLSVPSLGRGPMMTYCVLALTGWIPAVGTLLVLINGAIAVMMSARIADAVNALPAQ